MTDDINGYVNRQISRRELLKRVGLGAGLLILPGAISACGTKETTTSSASAETATSMATTTAIGAESLKIGFVSPRTGPAAGFGEADPFVLDLARKSLASGLTIGGKLYTVQIVEKDSQSDPAQAARVAQELLNSDKVDLVLATGAPETTNPVADTCEGAGMPCISTVAPWEAWYFGRGAKPGEPSPFEFTFHFSFGVEEFHKTYVSVWPQVATNKKIGVMWPNDADGNAIRAALGPSLVKDGYTVVDPGAYQDGTADFSAQIAQFKSAECDIFNAFPIPPDFATFWRQAAQQGYKPKIAQIAKWGIFASQVEALGDIAVNTTNSMAWAPSFPYTSSLTGISSTDLGNMYETASGKQWNQTVGTSVALMDVAVAALTAGGNPKDKGSIVQAMKTLKVDTPLGTFDWTTGPVPNVVVGPLINGQWVKGDKWPYEFITIGSSDPKVPIAAEMLPYA